MEEKKNIAIEYSVIRPDGFVFEKQLCECSVSLDEMNIISNSLQNGIPLDATSAAENLRIKLECAIEHAATTYLCRQNDPVALRYNAEENEVLPFDKGYKLSYSFVVFQKEECKKAKEHQGVLGSKEEKSMLFDYEATKNNPLDHHYVIQNLIALYYSARSNITCLNECILFCLEDLDLIDVFCQKTELALSLSKEDDEIIDKVHGDWQNNPDELKRSGEISNLLFGKDDLWKYKIPTPFCETYNKIIMCYEALKDYNKAVYYCDEAIDYCLKYVEFNSWVEKFSKRKDRYKKSTRLNKESS